MKTTDVIERLTQIHDGLYTYDITTSEVHRADKIAVVCNTHGVFNPTLHDHLYHTTKCPRCTVESRRTDFITAASETHGSRYDYSLVQYVNLNTPVDIVCRVHGVFTQVAGVHISSKVGCPQCRVAQRTHTSAHFITKAQNVHDNTYDYAAVNYVNTHTKVDILCREHGTFSQTPDNHLRGAGCPRCAGDTLRGKYIAGHYKSPNKVGQLYVARFTNDEESFIKVGITTQRSVSYRYGKKHMGYDVECIHTTSLPIRHANELERRILDSYHRHKYTPRTKFGGYTECLDLPQEVLDNLIQIIIEQSGV